MIDVARETSATIRRIEADLYERMICPFELDRHSAYHDLKFLGAKFGRFVTEWVYCRPCAIIWELERGVFQRATVNKQGLIVPRRDPIDDRNYRRTLARRALRKKEATCRSK